MFNTGISLGLPPSHDYEAPTDRVVKCPSYLPTYECQWLEKRMDSYQLEIERAPVG